MPNEQMQSGIVDKVLDRISNYDELNAATLKESNKKFAELLTDEDIKDELKKISHVFGIMREHLYDREGTYFGANMGFPQQQGPHKNLEAYHALKTGDVIEGYKKWIENEPEDGHSLFPGDKAEILYALGEGYDIFKAHYYIRDTDPWKSTEGRITSNQSQKSSSFPSKSEIEQVKEYFKREL